LSENGTLKQVKQKMASVYRFDVFDSRLIVST